MTRLKIARTALRLGNIVRWPPRDAGPGEFISSGGIELRCFGSNFDPSEPSKIECVGDVRWHKWDRGFSFRPCLIEWSFAWKLHQTRAQSESSSVRRIPSCNGYLAFTAMLMAGLDGLCRAIL
jgi:hypothetical protein